jgi:hypothetical protein
MNSAGITNRIYDFAVATCGWMRGGLAHVNNFGSSLGLDQSPYRRRHAWRSEACRPSYRRSPSKSAPRSLKRTAIFVVSQLRSPRCKGQASTRPADPPCGPPPSVGAAENPVTVQGHSDVPLDNGSCGEAASSPHFGRRSKEVSAPGHDLLGMIWYVGSVYTSGIAPAGLASPTDPKRFTPMKNGIVSPLGFRVMGTAILLGGFVAPLLAFLGAAFLGGAVRASIEDRRRRSVPVPATVRHRAF